MCGKKVNASKTQTALLTCYTNFGKYSYISTSQKLCLMPHSCLISYPRSYSTNTMACQLYDLWYRENCMNMLSDQNTTMNWNLSRITACIIIPFCKIKVLKHGKLYKDAYILQESFATTDKTYPSPCRNYLQTLYLSVTLYACAQRDDTVYCQNLTILTKSKVSMSSV